MIGFLSYQTFDMLRGDPTLMESDNSTAMVMPRGSVFAQAEVREITEQERENLRDRQRTELPLSATKSYGRWI